MRGPARHTPHGEVDWDPPAGAVAQEPIFLVKIRDVETLVPAQSPIRAQVSVFRALLQGTGWLDPERPVVAGVFEAGLRQTMVAMIPFRAPNANFQAVFNPVAREGYYLLTLPPQAGPGLAAVCRSPDRFEAPGVPPGAALSARKGYPVPSR